MEVIGILIDVKGVLFPRRCPICDSVLRFQGKKICGECMGDLVYICEPRCKKCGKQLDKAEQEYCYDCRNKKHFYRYGMAGFAHRGAIRKSVYKIKYEGKREYLDFYAEELVRLFGSELKRLQCDALIPVPMHRKRKQKRGYNQAEILALGISKLTGIPMEKRLLLRGKNTLPQKELNDKERRKNLENAFKINENIVKSRQKKSKIRRVILVDDIYTTGSTIDACAKLLQEYGVEEVYFICLSIGKGI